MNILNADHTEKTPSARERILQTAHELFYQEGVRATGVDRLIAQSKVTKTTFYRHFPSKNDLIYAFLEYRHQHFLADFTDTLHANGGTVEAICPTLEKWFCSEGFRGCAFINSLSELGVMLPEVVNITQRHKQDMITIIESLLPPSRQRKQNASAIALAIDGAIIRAQYDQVPDTALSLLKHIIKSLTNTKK